MYVCVCKGISDSQIREMVDDGCCSLRQIGQCCGAGRQCGRCCSMIRSLIKEMGVSADQCNDCPVKEAVSEESTESHSSSKNIPIQSID